MAKSNYDLEHVTTFLYRNKNRFKIIPVPVERKYQITKKLDIDREKDLKKIIDLVKINKININSSENKIINK